VEKLEILKYPDERLKRKSIEVVDFGKKFREFVEKLIYTMYNLPGGVGIAAPQVNNPIRTIIVDTSKSTHKTNKVSHGLMVLSNSKIVHAEGEIIFREGCMSVPDYTGNVKRFYYIKVEAQDINGNLITFDTEGFEAVVIQHEIDHLEGKVFIEKVVSPKDIFRRKVYKEWGFNNAGRPGRPISNWAFQTSSRDDEAVKQSDNTANTECKSS